MISYHFNTASDDEIRTGQTTDIYFRRTLDILQALGNKSHVTMEVRSASLPGEYTFGVVAGTDEIATLFAGKPVDIESFAEGTFFEAGEPVITVSGRYVDFGLLETALLGLLCQASGVATRAARCKKAAGTRTVLSFGARRTHPAIAPMIERSTYVGGCDGVAVVKSGDLLEIEPSGTIPHALILLLGDTVQAVKAFDRSIDDGIKRIALIDTFQEEKFEALRLAEALGDLLYGLRLDTPDSRRGDMLAILKEVRWELDLRGYQHIKFFVSGGLDIVEVDGKPMAKRGKRSGRKQVYQCLQCGRRRTVPAEYQMNSCECRGEMHSLLRPSFNRVKRLKKPGSQTIFAGMYSNCLRQHP